MRGVKLLVVEGAFALLLNATAGLMKQSQALVACRWGWAIFLLQLTYVAASSKPVIRISHSLKKRLRGGFALIAYLVIGALGAMFGVVYWRGIDTVFDGLFPTSVNLVFSPSFPEDQKAMVTEEFTEARAYLQGIGFETPSPIPPIQVNENSPRTTDGKSGIGVLSDPNPYGDSIIVSPFSATQRDQMRAAYFNWAFQRILEVIKYDMKENPNRWASPMIFGSYYSSSYSNTPFDALDWGRALWKIRSVFGKQFTDKLMFFTFQNFDEGRDSQKPFDVFFWNRLSKALNALDSGAYSRVIKILDEENIKWNAVPPPNSAPLATAVKPGLPHPKGHSDSIHATPSLDMTFDSAKDLEAFNFMNRSQQNLYLRGTQVDVGQKSLDDARTITPGGSYHIWAQALAQEIRGKLDKVPEIRFPMQVYVSTEDGQSYVITYQLWARMIAGVLSIETQNLGSKKDAM